MKRQQTLTGQPVSKKVKTTKQTTTPTKRRKETKKTSIYPSVTESGSNYVQCPLCAKSVYLQTFDVHFEECELLSQAQSFVVKLNSLVADNASSCGVKQEGGKLKSEETNERIMSSIPSSFPCSVNKAADEQFLLQFSFVDRSHDLCHVNTGIYSWNWHNEQDLTSFFVKRVVQKKLTDMSVKSSKIESEGLIRHGDVQYYGFDKVMKDAQEFSGHTMDSFEKIRVDMSKMRMNTQNTNDTMDSDFSLSSFKTAKQHLLGANIVDNDKQTIASVLDQCLMGDAEDVSSDQIDPLLNQYQWNADCPVRLKNNDTKIKFPIHLDLSSSSPNRVVSWASEGPSTTFSASFLKSLIQKSVRMCRPDSAVRAAKELMLSDFTEFIRRIPVVMCEDSLLHPGYPVIIWLMMACSKGYKPSLNDVNYCLQFVYEIASCEWRDFEWKERRELKEQDVSKVINQQTLSNLHPLEASLIKALLSRLAFGGMPVDAVMLRNHANIWARRFINHKMFQMPEGLSEFYPNMDTLPHICGIDISNMIPQASFDRLSPWMRFLLHAYSRHSKPVLSFESVSSLQKSDLLLKAVDMHCFPIVTKLFASDWFIHDKCQEFMRDHFNITLRDKSRGDMTQVQAYEQDVSDKMSSLIWTFRSGPNAKQCISGRDIESERNKDNLKKMEALWRELKSPLDAISMRFLVSKFQQDS